MVDALGEEEQKGREEKAKVSKRDWTHHAHGGEGGSVKPLKKKRCTTLFFHTPLSEHGLRGAVGRVVRVVAASVGAADTLARRGRTWWRSGGVRLEASGGGGRGGSGAAALAAAAARVTAGEVVGGAVAVKCGRGQDGYTESRCL